jgi:hypothetical protein
MYRHMLITCEKVSLKLCFFFLVKLGFFFKTLLP